MIRRRALALACSWTTAFTGCAYLPREAVVPMRVTSLPFVAGGRSPTLVIMLPGAYSLPQDFVDEGFVAALRDRHFEADLLLVDSHLGYAENGTLLARLRDDVLQPAVRRGYRHIWLVGISLGGFASLGLLMRHAQWLEGILVMSPYVGRPALVQRVAAAGGAVAFASSDAPPGDLEAHLWTWLARSDPDLRAKIHLYTGSDDRFIVGQRMLGALLAPGHVLELPGGHDWPVWRALWSRWLAIAPWPRTAANG